MNSEEKYALITKLYNQEGILVTSSHPDGVKCHFAIQWDEDVDEYIFQAALNEDENGSVELYGFTRLMGSQFIIR